MFRRTPVTGDLSEKGGRWHLDPAIIRARHELGGLQGAEGSAPDAPLMCIKLYYALPLPFADIPEGHAALIVSAEQAGP